MNRVFFWSLSCLSKVRLSPPAPFLSLKHMPPLSVVGVGQEGRILISPRGYLNRKLQLLSYLENY